MSKTLIITAAVLTALLTPVAARAHEGHAHKFMGTVSAVQDGQMQVKTTDGKVVTFVLDAKTIYQQGKLSVSGKLPKVGERVVVSALEVAAGKVMTAQTVQLPVPAPVTAAR